MGVFDPTYARLKLIIFIFIFLTALYASEYYLLNENVNTDINTDMKNYGNFDPDNYSEVRQYTVDTGGGLIEMIQFITFTPPELPDFMKAILAPISVICLIVEAYLIIDIAYDIVKGLPLT